MDTPILKPSLPFNFSQLLHKHGHTDLLTVWVFRKFIYGPGVSATQREETL